MQNDMLFFQFHRFFSSSLLFSIIFIMVYFAWSIQNRFWNLIAAKWLHINKLKIKRNAQRNHEQTHTESSLEEASSSTKKSVAFKNVLKNYKMKRTHSKYVYTMWIKLWKRQTNTLTAFCSMHHQFQRRLKIAIIFVFQRHNGQRRQVFCTNEPCSTLHFFYNLT